MNIMKIKISKKTIGENHPIFFVAEAGINHNGKLRLAKKLISEAKNAGSDAIKFQTFRADDLASRDSQYYNLFKKLEFTKEDFGELSDYSKENGIIFFSTPLSEEAIEILYELNVPAYKIASGDITNIPLIEYAASKQKPIILSTGMSNINEIIEGVNAIKNSNNNEIILLHSVSGYPTPYFEANLNAIKFLNKKFEYPIGFSDNGDERLVSLIAASLGARMIEKHFTLDRNMTGPDHKISSNPNQLKNMIQDIRKIEKMLGLDVKQIQNCEKNIVKQARRSLIALKPILKDEVITKEHIGIKRPEKGLQPKFLKKIIGKKSKKNIKEGQFIQWNLLK